MYVLVLWTNSEPRTTSIIPATDIKFTKTGVKAKWCGIFYPAVVVQKYESAEYLNSLNVDVNGALLPPNCKSTTPKASKRPVESEDEDDANKSFTEELLNTNIKRKKTELFEDLKFKDNKIEGKKEDKKENKKDHRTDFNTEDDSADEMADEKVDEMEDENEDDMGSETEHQMADEMEDRTKIKEYEKEKKDDKKSDNKDEKKSRDTKRKEEKAVSHINTDNSKPGSSASSLPWIDDIGNNSDLSDLENKNPSPPSVKTKGKLSADDMLNMFKQMLETGNLDNMRQMLDQSITQVPKSGVNKQTKQKSSSKLHPDNVHKNSQQREDAINHLISVCDELYQIEIKKHELKVMIDYFKATPNILIRKIMKKIFGDKLKILSISGKGNNVSDKIPEDIVIAVMDVVNRHIPKDLKISSTGFKRIITLLCNASRTSEEVTEREEGRRMVSGARQGSNFRKTKKATAKKDSSEDSD